MSERKVTLKGNPFTLTGHEIKVGDTAPDATLVANDLSAVKLSSFKGKKVILVAVPSLDTPVCDKEARRFNEEAAKLPDVKVVVASIDLPFAQKRWCAGAGIQNLQTLSDHKDAALGNAFGVLIKDLRLLARSIFVIDSHGTVQYIEVVPEVTSEPNYDAALQAVKKVS